MALKIGHVYKLDKKLIYIAGKRRYKRRLIYAIRRVYESGSLGPEFERMFKRGECKLFKNYKVVTFIQLPKAVKDTARFENLVSRARKIIKEKKPGYRMNVAKLAICCAEFQHPTEARACNLRDFARAVKFKAFNTLYTWVLKYYEFHYTVDKFEIAIPSAADSTIVKMIKTQQETYSSYYGFNKKLNVLLAKNAKAYLNEFRLRGLTLN